MKTKASQSRMFEHEDLPLFSGSCPEAPDSLFQPVVVAPPERPTVCMTCGTRIYYIRATGTGLDHVVGICNCSKILGQD